MKYKISILLMMAVLLTVGMAFASNHSQINETIEVQNETTDNETADNETALQPGLNETADNQTAPQPGLNETNQTGMPVDVQITQDIPQEVLVLLLTLVVIIVLLSIVVYIKNHGGMPWTNNLKKARNLHKRAQKLHKKGKEDKARKLYERARHYREQSTEVQ